MKDYKLIRDTGIGRIGTIPSGVKRANTKMFDFPKNCEWILNRYIEKGKPYYEFEIWQEGFPTRNIVYFKTATLKGILKKIKKLACQIK